MKHKATSQVQHTPSHLFIVRVWLEDLGAGKTEWRSQVKYVMSGEVRYFRERANLIMILQEMLAGSEKLTQGT